MYEEKTSYEDGYGILNVLWMKNDNGKMDYFIWAIAYSIFDAEFEYSLCYCCLFSINH